MLLMFRAPEPVPVEVHVSLRGSVGALSGGVLLGPLRGELSQGHLLRGNICKVSSHGKTILKQNQAKMTYNSFRQNTNINVNLEKTYTLIRVFL